MTEAAPMRADARRNRDRVLAAAQEAFAAEGLLVPLDEIARRAGVGAGTVYRHFATKEALFSEVVADRLEKIVDQARDLVNAEDPGAAFYEFFTRVVERAAFNRAICEALEHDLSLCTSQLESEFEETLGRLMVRAQQAGAVRADVEVADLRALLVGCVAMERGRQSPGRMVGIALDSLRPPVVTKRELRNVTCEVCSAPLPASDAGRPARYCSAACRQKAHRQRRRTEHHRRP